MDIKLIRYYESKDEYTVKQVQINGQMRYFLQFHDKSNSQEMEINYDNFTLYFKEFKWMLERQRDEGRRHIDRSNKDKPLTTRSFERTSLAKVDIEIALKKCTELEQRRFKQHYIQGYKFAEIARMEKCSEFTVRRSISKAYEKIKKYSTCAIA